MNAMTTSSKVGCIYNTIVPYFDRDEHKTKLKARPCLIISEPCDDKEYVILPVSTMLQRKFLDDRFDVYLNLQDYPKLGLHRDCYIRCGKQTLAYESGIDFKVCLGNLISDYPLLFESVILKMYEANRQRLKKYYA